MLVCSHCIGKVTWPPPPLLASGLVAVAAAQSVLATNTCLHCICSTFLTLHCVFLQDNCAICPRYQYMSSLCLLDFSSLCIFVVLCILCQERSHNTLYSQSGKIQRSEFPVSPELDKFAPRKRGEAKITIKDHQSSSSGISKFLCRCSICNLSIRWLRMLLLLLLLLLVQLAIWESSNITLSIIWGEPIRSQQHSLTIKHSWVLFDALPH